jgi:hypothetical protein
VFDWLFEGQTTVYILLIVVLIGLFVVYWQWRRRVWLYGMAVVVALIGLYWLLDRLVETDREQIHRKIGGMASGLQAHNVDAVFKHISDNFRSPQGEDKNELHSLAERRINQVTHVIVWNIRRDSRPQPGKDYSDLRFSFKVNDEFPFDCQPVFEHDAANGWRLKGLKIFKFGTTEEFPIPFSTPFR